jgi:hypothetical protein
MRFVEFYFDNLAPLLCTIAAVGGLTYLVVALVRDARANERHKRNVLAGLCPVCGYDLRSSYDRCPECGAPLPLRRRPPD